MFVMLPMMYLSRKIDGDDPNMVFYLRCAYGTVQAIILTFTIFCYLKAQKLAGKENSEKTIYVPHVVPFPPPAPDAKKQYKEVKYGAHLITTSRGLLGSTLFGCCITVALHLWKGMIVGLAMQSVMGPLNLLENAFAKAVLLGQMEGRIFGEKTASELSNDDEIVDNMGNVVEKTIKKKKSLEEVLLDTWEEGVTADVSELLSMLTKKNINYKTKGNGWTPIMIMAALGVKETASAMRQLKRLGADPSICDNEGWNALHWACFHGSIDGAVALVLESEFDGTSLKGGNLHTVKDKDGKYPAVIARAEGNIAVAEIIEKRIVEKGEEGLKDTEGLRKRK